MSLSNGKTPGSDGLSVDFYKHFWVQMSNCVTESLDYAFALGKLSDEQGRAVISLIEKPGKCPLKLSPDLLDEHRLKSLCKGSRHKT